MADIPESDAVLPPVSSEAPCGPDLDAEGDAAFLNFMAGAEGQLPGTFYTLNRQSGMMEAFDRKSIDFPGMFDSAGKLLARTHDLRLLALMAKLAILNRDLAGFAHWFAVIARLLKDRWDEAHPRGEDADFAFRAAQLSTLEDAPVILQPLQNTPLAETRDGAVTFRAQMIAADEIKPREGEAQPNSSTIDKILLNEDMTRLTQTLAYLRSVKASAAGIRSVWIERAGFDNAPNLEALTALLDRIAAFVNAAIARRDPGAAEPVQSGGAEAARETAASAPANFATISDIDSALGSALAYFETAEPSSAAVLLIGQSRYLLGRNLFEVLKALTPSHADSARVYVGADTSFAVPVSAISGKQSLAESLPPANSEPAPSRAAAIALIDAVATHLRRAEPSSPLPWLLDRARALASRDFVSLLKDVLSEDAIAQMKSRT
jgi:type VI secretion system protein ImpA